MQTFFNRNFFRRNWPIFCSLNFFIKILSTISFMIQPALRIKTDPKKKKRDNKKKDLYFDCN